MRRRDLVVLASTALASTLLARYTLAKSRCGPFFGPGLQDCEAGIDSGMASISAAAVGGQHLSQWCWAACIEMVFRYYGFVVPQEIIVAQTWGSIVNLPAQPGQILANLNRPWIDRYGRRFGVAGDVFSANPATAAQDLAQDMPLIIGTMGHAMVLTSLRYVRDQYGRGDVKLAIVRDPWPNQGRRELTAEEWYSANFLVRIRVGPIW